MALGISAFTIFPVQDEMATYMRALPSYQYYIRRFCVQPG